MLRTERIIKQYKQVRSSLQGCLFLISCTCLETNETIEISWRHSKQTDVPQSHMKCISKHTTSSLSPRYLNLWLCHLNSHKNSGISRSQGGFYVSVSSKRQRKKEKYQCLSFQPVMMAWIILLTLVSLSSAVPSKRQVSIEEILPFTPSRNEQRGSLRSFRRDAIERPPTPTFDRLSNYFDYNEFGSHRYPLRDAVEKLPVDVLYAKSRHKLRDDYERWIFNTFFHD